jgi:hypothetical protein
VLVPSPPVTFGCCCPTWLGPPYATCGLGEKHRSHFASSVAPSLICSATRCPAVQNSLSPPPSWPLCCHQSRPTGSPPSLLRATLALSSHQRPPLPLRGAHRCWPSPNVLQPSCCSHKLPHGPPVLHRPKIYAGRPGSTLLSSTPLPLSSPLPPVTVGEPPAVQSPKLDASHLVIPQFQEQDRSLLTCAQDVQMTRTANNMVNRYNISLNYKRRSYKMTLGSEKKITERRNILYIGAASTGATEA